jgi:hypothetical protein
MNAGAHIEAQCLYPVDNGPRAVDRPPGAVECGEEAVAGGIHLAATVACQFAPHKRVVALNKVSPGAVTERRRPCCRTDDVSKEESRQDSIAPNTRNSDISASSSASTCSSAAPNGIT